MLATITANRSPADAIQQGNLESLLSSPGFSLLKEVIAAHCIIHQVEAMNARLYPESVMANSAAGHAEALAIAHGHCLEVLDDILKNKEKWFTVKLEHRR